MTEELHKYDSILNNKKAVSGLPFVFSHRQKNKYRLE